MAAERNLIYYMVLNTVIPGLGQFFLRRWLRGILIAGGALAAFGWAVTIVVMPLWHNVRMLLADVQQGEIVYVDLPRFAVAVALLLAVWCWSLLDVMLWYWRRRTIRENKREDVHE